MKRVPILALALAAVALGAEKPGDTLRTWSAGQLEIHQISTGRGNAAFFIFPDGTTMLVDAGCVGDSGPHFVPARPSDSKTAGEWVARYVKRRHPRREPVLDYALLTHFHPDHIGNISDARTSRYGDYKLSGITEVGEHIAIRTILDRAWPNYERTNLLANYRAFLAAQAATRGMHAQRFRPGADDQIVPVHRGSDYPRFAIRNIAANGQVWTGKGQEARSVFPPLEGLPKSQLPVENMLSTAFRLTYGKFDYFNGGDMPGVLREGQLPWHDIETPVAGIVGAVDVSVVNHHGVRDSANATFVATLRPRVWVLPVWSSAHGSPAVLDRLFSAKLYAGPRDIFATDRHEDSKHFSAFTDRLKSTNGHIVIRVARSGESYEVLILDNKTESYKVIAVHGPYPST